MLFAGTCYLFGDAVQISLSLRCQFAAPISVLSHHIQLLRGSEDSSGHALGASADVAGQDIISLISPLDLGHGADPSAAPEVQVLR